MTLLEAVYVYLASKTQITSTASVGTRIYRLKRPQGTALPAITYRKLSEQNVGYQSGVSTLSRARIGIDCWAALPDAAETVRNAVRDVCQNYSGTVSDAGEDVEIVHSWIEDDFEDFEEPADASDTGVYKASIDWLVWWRPAVPSP